MTILWEGSCIRLSLRILIVRSIFVLDCHSLGKSEDLEERLGVRSLEKAVCDEDDDDVRWGEQIVAWGSGAGAGAGAGGFICLSTSSIETASSRAKSLRHWGH